MRRLLLILFFASFSGAGTTAAAPPVSVMPDSLLVMFWNLENMFDTDASNGGEEFSPQGSRRWTWKRFNIKCEAVSKVIFAVSDRFGRLPDVIAFAEIENGYVLRKIVSSTNLRKYRYACVHFESRDPRGIDVGLLYRKDVLDVGSARPVRLDSIATRDILCVDFMNGPAVLVNHHPSKFSGARQSDSRRKAAMRCMMETVDSLKKCGKDIIISTGDFNAPGDDPNFGMADGIMVNKSLELLSKGLGTIRYDGRWELIDMFFTTGVFQSRMHIFDFPALLCRDKAHGGMKPFRTYSGPRYNGGVSDHLPIVLECEFN